MNTKINFLEKYATKSNQFYKSNKSMIFFMSIISGFILLQFILFGLGKLDINGVNVNDKNAWMIWLLTIVTSIGSACGFYGGVLIVRFDTKFLAPTLINASVNIFSAFITKVYFLGLVNIFTFLMYILRYKSWKEHQIGTKIDNGFTKKTFIILFLVASIFFIFGSILINIDSISNIMYGDLTKDPNATKIYLRWFDIISGTMIIIAIMLMNSKSRYAFVVYFINKILIITIFAVNGNIIIVVQTILFSTMDITGFLSWTYNDLKKKQSKKNEIV